MGKTSSKSKMSKVETVAENVLKEDHGSGAAIIWLLYCQIGKWIDLLVAGMKRKFFFFYFPSFFIVDKKQQLWILSD